jgi:hypothetical protein
VTIEEFRASLAGGAPPPGLRAVLRALWHAGREEWDAAHEIAQSVDDAEGAWVHAHLHRREGDLGNASYWYSRAGQPRSDLPLEREWHEITGALLPRPAPERPDE